MSPAIFVVVFVVVVVLVAVGIEIIERDEEEERKQSKEQVLVAPLPLELPTQRVDCPLDSRQGDLRPRYFEEGGLLPEVVDVVVERVPVDDA
jgi:hypothetical protein